MAKKPDHLHRYRRTTLGDDYKVYKCIKPGCSHYVSIKLAENALCECNRCGHPMIMTKIAMTLAKPHCQDCTKTKKDVSDITRFLEDRI